MKKKPKKLAPEQIAPDSDEHFAYIAGYTGGGAPYGVTWDEMGATERSAADGVVFYSTRISGVKP